MASGTDFQGNSGQAAIDRFAAMMIERMQQMKDEGIDISDYEDVSDALEVFALPDGRYLYVEA